jgi:hypothetical protein
MASESTSLQKTPSGSGGVASSGKDGSGQTSGNPSKSGSNSSGSLGSSGSSGSSKSSSSSGSSKSSGSATSSLSSSSSSSKAIFKLGNTCFSVVCVESPDQKLILRLRIDTTGVVSLHKVFCCLCSDIFVTACRSCEIQEISHGVFLIKTEFSQTIEFTGTLKHTTAFRPSNEEEFQKQAKHYREVAGCL